MFRTYHSTILKWWDYPLQRYAVSLPKQVTHMFLKSLRMFRILDNLHFFTRNTPVAYSTWVKTPPNGTQTHTVWMEHEPLRVFVFKLLMHNWLKVRTPSRRNLWRVLRFRLDGARSWSQSGVSSSNTKMRQGAGSIQTALEICTQVGYALNARRIYMLRFFLVCWISFVACFPNVFLNPMFLLPLQSG